MNILSTWAGSVWNAVFDQRKAFLLPNENHRGGLAFKASHCWHNWQLPGPIRSREQFHAGIQVGLWNPPCSRCRYFEIIEIQKGPTDDSITVKRNEDKQLGKSMGKSNLHARAPSKEWIEVKSSLLPVGLWASVNRRVKRVEKSSVCATLTPKGSLPCHACTQVFFSLLILLQATCLALETQYSGLDWGILGRKSQTNL